MPEPTSSGGFNRYRYTRNNPLKFTDPTGHAECFDVDCEHLVNPITKKFLGNKEITESFPLGVESVNTRPAPPAPQVSTLFSVASTAFDGLALGLSASGAVGEIQGFAKGFAEGIGVSSIVAIGSGIVEAAAQNANYQLLRDDYGDGAGYASLVSTILGDITGGNTYITQDQADGRVLIVGSSTQFSFGAAVLGDRQGIAMADMIIDGVAVYNDVTSLFGGIGPFRPISEQITPLRVNLPDDWPSWLPEPNPPPPNGTSR